MRNALPAVQLLLRACLQRFREGPPGSPLLQVVDTTKPMRADGTYPPVIYYRGMRNPELREHMDSSPAPKPPMQPASDYCPT